MMAGLLQGIAQVGGCRAPRRHQAEQHARGGVAADANSSRQSTPTSGTGSRLGAAPGSSPSRPTRPRRSRSRRRCRTASGSVRELAQQPAAARPRCADGDLLLRAARGRQVGDVGGDQRARTPPPPGLSSAVCSCMLTSALWNVTRRTPSPSPRDTAGRPALTPCSSPPAARTARSDAAGRRRR